MGLARRLIPCLDVDAGRVVKGVRFVDIRDAGDPVEAARRYDAEGADELVFLDITASAHERGTMADVVERTAAEVFIPLTVGGGIRNLDDIHRLLNVGADKVSINTAAVHDPGFVRAAAGHFGSQCIVVAIDAKRDGAGFSVYTHGGRRETDINAIEWAARMEDCGAGELLLTSMDRDGTGDGFDIELTRAVTTAVTIPVIASGGVGKPEHLAQGVLEGGADAVLCASIFHFGQYTIAETKAYMRERGIEVML